MYQNTKFKSYFVLILLGIAETAYSNRVPMLGQFGRLKEYALVLSLFVESYAFLVRLVCHINTAKLALRQIQYNLCENICQYFGK